MAPRIALAAGLASLAAPARATDWLCGLEAEQTRLVCVADPDPDLPGAPTAAAASGNSTTPPAPVARVRGTAFPLDPTRKWAVDLWTPPSDVSWVYQLAQATICYRSTPCRVWLVHGQQMIGPVREAPPAAR